MHSSSVAVVIFWWYDPTTLSVRRIGDGSQVAAVEPMNA